MQLSCGKLRKLLSASRVTQGIPSSDGARKGVSEVLSESRGVTLWPGAPRRGYMSTQRKERPTGLARREGGHSPFQLARGHEQETTSKARPRNQRDQTGRPPPGARPVLRPAQSSTILTTPPTLSTRCPSAAGWRTTRTRTVSMRSRGLRARRSSGRIAGTDRERPNPIDRHLAGQ